jgi:hypothetical protein
MRKLLPVVLAVVLLPVGVAAQKAPVKNAPARVMDAKDPAASQAQATAAAVQAVRGQLQQGLLRNWPARSDGGGAIPPASVTVAGALFNPTGGKDGAPVWVVGVSSPNGKGTVRVLVNARTGAVVPAGSESASFSWGMYDWGAAPAYWRQGLSSPPPAKSN